MAYTLLRDDILANDAEALAEDTVYAYTNALRKVSWSRLWRTLHHWDVSGVQSPRGGCQETSP